MHKSHRIYLCGSRLQEAEGDTSAKGANGRLVPQIRDPRNMTIKLQIWGEDHASNPLKSKKESAQFLEVLPRSRLGLCHSGKLSGSTSSLANVDFPDRFSSRDKTENRQMQPPSFKMDWVVLQRHEWRPGICDSTSASFLWDWPSTDLRTRVSPKLLSLRTIDDLAARKAENLSLEYQPHRSQRTWWPQFVPGYFWSLLLLEVLRCMPRRPSIAR